MAASSATIMSLGTAKLDGDFQVGEWLVSPALNRISRNGDNIRVEPKAMQVLVHLAEHPRVVSKQELMSAVWPDVFVADDVLPGCISALRKAFHDDARRPRVIETIHKSGYRLLQPVKWNEHNGHATVEPAPSKWGNLRSHRSLAAIGVIVLAAVLVGAFAWYPSQRRYESLAVLPFVDSNHDSATQYLSDGIAQQVIDDLSKLSSLRVMAWTTVERYREAQSDPRAIGRWLAVRAILTGRLVQEGDHVVVQTELVDVRNGSQLWGQQYKPAISDMPALQEQLSRDIAANLKIRLSGDEQHKIFRRYTDNPAAYELYLKGRFFWNKRTKQGLQQGIEYFQQAIQVDPNDALAYAGLADCYNLLDDWGETAPRDSFPKAKAAAERAIALDDSLAEAHASLAMVRGSYYWDWSGAEQEFQRAIALNPNYATAHQWYGLFLAGLGRFPQAETEVKRAQELEPLSPIINMGIAEVYTWQRRYDEAIEQYKKLMRFDPSFFGAYGNLAAVYEQKHMYPDAMNMLQQKWNLYGDPRFAQVVQRAYLSSGYSAALREQLKRYLQQSANGRYVDPIGIAAHYAALGDQPKALEWLQRGYEAHSSSMQFLAVSPDFDSIRKTPQFQYWLTVLGLPNVPLGAPVAN
jgi:TolB-like protein/DNA-binding winged helix-turn-helix (wHTH) protein/Tfp pilus assembly protein PilF